MISLAVRLCTPASLTQSMAMPSDRRYFENFSFFDGGTRFQSILHYNRNSPMHEHIMTQHACMYVCICCATPHLHRRSNPTVP